MLVMGYDIRAYCIIGTHKAERMVRDENTPISILLLIKGNACVCKRFTANNCIQNSEIWYIGNPI